MTYTVMVSGSRSWRQVETLRSALAGLYRPGARLIHGACPEGADEIAARVGEELGYTVVPFPPDKRIPSPARFHARNDEMLDEIPSYLVAAWDGVSRGTFSVICKARELGIHYFVLQDHP